MIYLGSYAAGSGQGIAVISLRDGVLGLRSTAECPARPAYLAVAPGGRAPYAAHELGEGLVSAFAVGDRGDLRLLGTQPSGGAQPCHLSVHPSGRYVLSAHWGSGSIAVYPVERGGILGPATELLENPEPHAHMVVTDPGGAGSSRCISARARSRPLVSTLEPDGCGFGARWRCIAGRALGTWRSIRAAPASTS